MFVNFVGGVVNISRNVNGSKLSVITIAEQYAGQVNENGSWSKKRTGYFDFRIWENNLQAGMNVDFTATLEKLKKGDQVNILAEITDIKTVKDGKVVDRKPVFTAVRLTQIYSYNNQDSEDRVAKINTVMESSEEDSPAVGLESGLDPFE